MKRVVGFGEAMVRYAPSNTVAASKNVQNFIRSVGNTHFFFKVKFILFSRFSIADRLSREHFGLGSSKNQLCHEKGFGPLPKTDDFRKDQSTKKVEFLYQPSRNGMKTI